jgi:mono/diheme cytochrome c family protein
MRAFLAACVMIAAAGAASAQNLPSRSDAQAGERLAQRVCGACHTVAAQQHLSPLVPGYGPSFYDVARHPGTTTQSLAGFLSHPHPYGQMPYPALTPAQIADVSAYILSLRGRH